MAVFANEVSLRKMLTTPGPDQSVSGKIINESINSKLLKQALIEWPALSVINLCRYNDKVKTVTTVVAKNTVLVWLDVNTSYNEKIWRDTWIPLAQCCLTNSLLGQFKTHLLI